jgi:hypothetical protein
MLQLSVALMIPIYMLARLIQIPLEASSLKSKTAYCALVSLLAGLVIGYLGLVLILV